MKMKLAIYTAQEGYSWQPGTAFTIEELVAFKKSIGKFPSPDSAEFPFGGIFLLEDRVVFYRYHVAKKIDFRGRDALYCVLGAVSREDAAKIDPAALFACPEFAGPMKPFPTELELPEADSSTVPEWLKNLDSNTLDVRITGTADNPSYAVIQEPIEIPQPPVSETTVPVPPAPPPADPGSAEPVPAPDGGAQSPSAPQCGVPDSQNSVPDDSGARPVRQLPRRLVWQIASAAAMAVLLIGGSIWFAVGTKQGGNGDAESGLPQTNGVVVTGAPEGTIPADTNNLPEVTISTNGIPPAANVVDVSTNTLQTATNVSAAVTNAAPVEKSAPAPTTEKSAQKTVQKKATVPNGRSPAMKKAVPMQKQLPKGKR